MITLINDQVNINKNSFLINKFNSVIVAIAKKEYNSTWTTFISELAGSAQSSMQMCHNNMKILQLFSEEINTFWKDSLTTKKAMEMKNKMNQEFMTVLDLCKNLFQISNQLNQDLLIECLKLFGEYTNWFPINYVLDNQLLSFFFNEIKKNNILEQIEIIKCLGKIISISNVQKNDPNYYNIKQTVMQIYKTLIEQAEIIVGTKNIPETSLMSDKFEKFCLILDNSIFSFFQENFTFIEQNDFEKGTQKGNQFTNTYGNAIQIGLKFMCEFLKCSNEEIFKTACEFWYWFIFKVALLENFDFDPTKNYDNINRSVKDYIANARNSYCYVTYYESIFDIVRDTVITKMNKPLEVKIDIDENGDLVTDPTTNTVFQSIHSNLSDILQLLTFFDQAKTTNLLENYLQRQISNANNTINKSLISSLAWSIGSIPNALDEDIGNKFIVFVIRTLLNLTELAKGKDNKAICASNIMYVVGQYPNFLRKYWKFLKTVVKKLFEFMHELHPGVRDFACETFLKIAFSCGKEFIKINQDENEPYINVLVRNISQDTNDLKDHQKLMFYEAIGIIISNEQDQQLQYSLLSSLLSSTYNIWEQTFSQAQNNIEYIHNAPIVKTLEMILRINERVCKSTKMIYWSFGKQMLDNMIKIYCYFSDSLNRFYSSNTMMDQNVRAYISFNKTVIKYLITLVDVITDKSIIINELIPKLNQFIIKFNESHVNNKDPNTFIMFAHVIEKVKNSEISILGNIYQNLFRTSIAIISDNYLSYPEFRVNLVKLLKSMILYTTDSFFTSDISQVQEIMDMILFECQHTVPVIMEIGFETLIELTNQLIRMKENRINNVLDNYCRVYYFRILDTVLDVLTDSCHKGAFYFQVEVIRLLLIIVEKNVVSEGILAMNEHNKNYIYNHLVNFFSSKFTHLIKTQIEAFCMEMFNKCLDKTLLTECIRDVLITLKSFSENNEELYEEEKNAQIQEAQRIQNYKQELLKNAPLYTAEFEERIKSSNYN